MVVWKSYNLPCFNGVLCVGVSGCYFLMTLSLRHSDLATPWI